MLMHQTQSPMQTSAPLCRLGNDFTRMRGVGLIEVLIAVLVLSVGIVGVAGLQLNAKRAGFEAVQRSTASALAQDILERMRGNPQARDNYLTSGVGGGTIQTAPTPACDDDAATSVCDPTELAAHDLWEWEQAIDGVAEKRGTQSTGGLVSPTACITSDAATGTVTVAIAWLGTRDMSDPTANTCGRNLGRYGTNDKRRQLLTVTAFITSKL